MGRQRIPNKGDLRYQAQVARDQEFVHLKRQVEQQAQRIAELESGETVRQLLEANAALEEKFARREEYWQRKYAALEARMDRAVKKAHLEWEKVNDEVVSDCDREKEALRREAAKAWEQAGRAEDAYQKEHQAKIDAKKREYEARCENEDLKEEVAKRDRLLRQDETNSSFTSAQSDRPGRKSRKKRHDNNSRKKSDQKQGAQPGHKGRPRPEFPVTGTVILDPPKCVQENDEWVETGRIKNKYLVDFRIVVDNTRYQARQWRNKRTGELVWAEFPPEMTHNEMSYGVHLQAFILLLTAHCNVAGRKVVELLSEISGGALHPSHGFVASIPGKFARKAKADVDRINRELCVAKSIHADTTVVKVNGERHAVTVCVNDEAGAWFRYTPKKGKAAVEGTPFQQNVGGVKISDCEAAFLNLLGMHSVCHEHLKRECQDAIENETGKTWAKEMLDFFEDQRRERAQQNGRELTREEKRAVRERYDAIIAKGEEEYEYEPARKSYPNGHNLLKRLKKHRASVLRFLEFPDIDLTNNISERSLRAVKRHLHAIVTWRSEESVEEYCQVLTILTTEVLLDRSPYKKFLEILSRPATQSRCG